MYRIILPILRNIICILVVSLSLLGCWDESNVRFESGNIEEKMEKSRVKLIIKNFNLIDTKYQSYFINSVREYFLKNTDIVVDDENYEHLIDFEILDFNFTLVQDGNSNKARFDLTGSVSITSFDNKVILSNHSFSYTFATNIDNEVLNEPFSRSVVIDNLNIKFFDSTALNFVYFVSTGWKGDYGYYSIKDGIIQRIFGGIGTNEQGTSKRTNKRNIPIIGGE